MSHTLIAAHRGGAGLWAENSLTAFRHAIYLPIDLIEFDVHRSRDGALVVHHDALLDRTTTGSGPLCEKAWPDLQRLAVKGTFGERMPLLDEVVDLTRPTPIDLRLEFKCRADGSRYVGFEAEIVARLRDKDMVSRTIFTSFHWGTLETALGLAEPRGAVALARSAQIAEPEALAATIAQLKALGLGEIGVPASAAAADLFARVRDAGLRIGLFGVNTREAIAQAFDLQASAFTTDRPDWAIAERAKRAVSA